MPCPNPPRGVRPPDCCAFTKQSGVVPGASPHPGLRLDEADFGVVRSPSSERANHPIFADQVRLPSTTLPPPTRFRPPIAARCPSNHCPITSAQQCRRSAVPQPSPAVSGVTLWSPAPEPSVSETFRGEALLSVRPVRRFPRHLWDRAITAPLPLLPERPFPQPPPVIARVACDLSSERSSTHKKGWSRPLSAPGHHSPLVLSLTFFH